MGITSLDNYIGDRNPEYGGVWFDLSNWPHYVEAVRITDLDSACGFDGAVLVERVIVFGYDDRKRVRDALGSGLGLEEFKKIKGKHNRQIMVLDALISYGFYDPDDDYYGNHGEVIQCDPNGPTEHNGWKVDRRLEEDEELENYLENNYLNNK